MIGKIFDVGIRIKGHLDGSVYRATNSAIKDQRKLGGAVKAVQSRFSSAREARKYGRVLNNMRAKQQRLGKSSEQFEKILRKTERRYDQARRGAQGYARELDDVARNSKKAADANDRLFSKKDVARGVMLGGAALLGVSARQGLKDEEAVAYLATVINASDGDQQAAAQRSRLSARQYSRRKDTIVGEAELIKVEYEMNSAGLEEEVARFGARVSHKVAKVTRGESEAVAVMIGQTYNNMGDRMVGDTEQKLRRIGNLATQTQLQYQISDFSQLSSGVQNASAAAVDNKVPEDQLFSIIGQLNQQGVSRERAGTAFSAIMRSLSKAADEQGFEMARAEDGTLDLILTLERLNDSLSGMGIDERSTLLQSIFGEEGKVGVSPLLANLEKLKAGHEKLVGAVDTDVLEEKYQSFVKIGNGGLKRMTDSIGQFASGVGDRLIKPLGFVFDTVSGGFNAMSAMMDRVPLFGWMITGLAVSVVGLGAAMATTTTAAWAFNAAMSVSTNRYLVGMVSSLGSKLMFLGRAAFPVATAGARAFSLAAMLNPVGLAIGAIALAGWALWKWWKPVKAFFKGLWSEIGPPIMEFKAGLDRFADSPFFKSVMRVAFVQFRVIGWVLRQVGNVLSWFTTQSDPTAESLEKTYSAGAKFGRFLKTIGKFMMPVTGAFKAFKAVLNWVSMGFDKLADTKFGRVMQTIGEFTSPVTAIFKAFELVLNGISSAFDKIENKAQKAMAAAAAVARVVPGGGVFAGVKAIGQKMASNDNQAPKNRAVNDNGKPEKPNLITRLFGRKDDDDGPPPPPSGPPGPKSPPQVAISRPLSPFISNPDRAVPPPVSPVLNVTPAREVVQSTRPAQSSGSKKVTYEGDKHEWHVSGVVDAESFIREIEPHMERRDRERRRRQMYDGAA